MNTRSNKCAAATAAMLPCSVRGGNSDALFTFNRAHQRWSLSLDVEAEDEKAHMQMGPRTRSAMDPSVQKQRGVVLARGLCLVYFLVCVGLWTRFGVIVCFGFSLLLRGEADSLGRGILFVLMMFIGQAAFAIGSILAWLPRLPLELWILSLAPASVVILAGTAMFAMELIQEL